MREEQEEVKRSYQVEIEVITKHVFVVDDVNTQEEAEMIAEGLLEDGEMGDVLDREVTETDSYLVGSEEDFN